MNILRLLYIATYDICDPKRLRRVFTIMRGYGEHLQFSVFRCELTDRERSELMAKLHSEIKHDEDQVLFFPMGPAGGFKESGVFYVGRSYQPSSHGAIVI